MPTAPVSALTWRFIMKCSNCGAEIPFSGKVCPFCHADKSKDQAFTASISVGGVIGILIGLMAQNLVVGLISVLICGVGAGLVCKFVQFYVQFYNETKQPEDGRTRT